MKNLEIEFIRTLDWKLLTSSPIVVKNGIDRGEIETPFLVDKDKMIFCGPKLIDGCKTTYDLVFASFIYLVNI